MSQLPGGRRAFLLGTLALIAASPSRAQPARVPRIGYLLQSPVTEPPSRERQAFLDGLRDYGYVPGRTVEILYRSAENEPAFMDDIAREMLELRVDVIVTSGAAATLSARNVTRKIPVVMLALGDPVGVGAVASLARPGGNVTGVSFISSDLAPKRVQLVKEILPGAKRVAVFWDPRNANARQESGVTIAAVRRFGMTPQPYVASSESELGRVLDRLAEQKPDVLYIAFEGGLVAAHRTTLAEHGLRQRAAVVSGWSAIVDAGGLLSYAPDIPAMFRRAASYVHRVLQGEKPATLPIEMPTRIDLVINLRTAKALGIVVPQSVLLRADRVIE